MVAVLTEEAVTGGVSGCGGSEEGDGGDDGDTGGGGGGGKGPKIDTCRKNNSPLTKE